MKAPYLIRTAIALMLASAVVDGVVMKTVYAHGGGGGGGGAGNAAGAANGSGASGAGAGGDGAGGGFAYTPELSAIEAFLRSPRAIHSAQKPKVTVRSTFVKAIGQRCRVVEETVTIDRKKVRASGTLCRRANGRWALKR